MFNWSISLSDKQVIMLMAFFSAEPDNNGCQFHAVHSSLGNAWDLRAVRKMEEINLIHIENIEAQEQKPEGRDHIFYGIARRKNRWTITMKGRLIAEAIMEDAEALKNIKLQNHGSARGELQDRSNDDFFAKREKQRQEKKAK